MAAGFAGGGGQMAAFGRALRANGWLVCFVIYGVMIAFIAPRLFAGQIDVTPLRGQVLMSGPQDKPLLVLDRVEQGRIAVLASDQAWLWGRGYEGGGPQLELLRRLAHWMLKEPELEEEALSATAKGDVLTITRRTLADHPPEELTITGPDGAVATLTLPQNGPGMSSPSTPRRPRPAAWAATWR